MNNFLLRPPVRRYVTIALSDGTPVRLRSMLRSEQRKWKKLTSDGNAKDFSDDVLIAMCIVNENGDQAISCEDALTGAFDDWDMLDCQLLLRACFQLCFPDEQKSASLEAAIKNLKTIHGNGSASGSAEPTVACATN